MRIRVISIIFLGVLSVLLGFIFISSLQWRMVHDSPIMMYLTFLIDHEHYVPYRDFFDMNMPGTYLVNLLIALFYIKQLKYNNNRQCNCCMWFDGGRQPKKKTCNRAP